MAAPTYEGTMTETPQTIIDGLRVKQSDLDARIEHANNGLRHARSVERDVAGRRVLGEADGEELAEARANSARLAGELDELESARAILASRIQAAEAAALKKRLADLRKRQAQLVKERALIVGGPA